RRARWRRRAAAARRRRRAAPRAERRRRGDQAGAGARGGGRAVTRGPLALGAAGAAIVVAAMIGLYVLLRTDRAPAPAPPRQDLPEQRIADDGSGKARNRAVPVLRQDGSAAPGRTAGQPSTRDHRTAEHAAADPPPPDPPAGRTINVQVTSDLSQVLRPALQECAANLAPGTAGDLSRIDGQVVIAIK